MLNAFIKVVVFCLISACAYCSTPKIDSLIEIDKLEKHSSLDSNSYKRKAEIANTYLNQGDFANAGKYFDEIETELLTLDFKFRAKHHLNKIRYWGMQRNLTEAAISARKAIGLSKQSGNRKTLAQANFNLGTIYMYQKKLDSSIYLFLDSRKYFEEQGDAKSINSILNNLSVLYNSNGDYDRALEYNLELIKNAISQDDKVNLASGYSNRAINLHEKGREDSVLIYQLKALKLYHQLNDKNNIARQSSNIGAIYRRQKKFTEAESYLAAALEMYEEIGQVKPQSNVLVSLGRLRTDQGRIEEGIVLLKKALGLTDTSEIQTIESIHRDLGISYELNEQYDLATKHLKISNSLKDSIEQLSNLQLVYEHEIRYQSDKLKDSLSRLQISHKSIANKVGNRNAFLGCLFVASCGLIWLLRKKKLRQDLLERKVELFQKEKEDLIFTKNELHSMNAQLHSQLGEKPSYGLSKAQSDIKFKIRKKTYIYPSKEVAYVKSEDNGIRIHTSDGSSEWLDTNLKTLEELNSGHLLRSHRQYVINVDKIKSVSSNLITLENNEAVPIGRAYKQRVMARLHTN